MRILVIGGTSFIGPHVVERLVQLGHEVAVFHRGKTADQFSAPVAVFRGDRRRLADSADELRRCA